MIGQRIQTWTWPTKITVAWRHEFMCTRHINPLSFCVKASRNRQKPLGFVNETFLRRLWHGGHGRKGDDLGRQDGEDQTQLEGKHVDQVELENTMQAES
jgi:hypothetical protein